MTKIALSLFLIFTLSGCVEAKSVSTSLPTVPVSAERVYKSPLGYPDFASLVVAHGSAVVNISVVQKKAPSAETDEAIELLKKLIPNLPDISPDKVPKIPSKGLGSGFFITADGYLLTNAHVVEDADKVTVRTYDKKEHIAKIIGVDVQSDIALLKIEGTYPVVTIGNPAQAMPGEWVAAIGSPFGFENSVTAGIISAKGRFLPDDNYFSFIQTDVAINPGNSGGPLFNLNGEVIGINSQIYSRTGGYMGMSFSIPIDSALKIAEQLKLNGKISRSRLGIQINPISSEMAEILGLPDKTGVIVGQISPDSPAANAGLLIGDIILECDGVVIESSQMLTQKVSETKSGDVVKLLINRQGKSMIISSSVIGSEKISDTKVKPKLEIKPNKLGIVFKDNTNVVDNVSNPALQAGLLKGDVILSIQNNPVINSTEIMAWLDKNPKAENILLLVSREGNNRFMILNIGVPNNPPPK